MDNKKTEKTIILGKGGSGKSFLFRKLVEKGLKPCIKYTTRPNRKYEKDDYNFIDDSKFMELITENKFLTYQSFTVTPENKNPEIWHYGITKEDFESSQVFIMTPEEFSHINPDIRKGCFVVYLDIDRKTREERLNIREDRNDSINRRLNADEEDFKNFHDYDLRVTDPDFGADDVYNLMS
jgi:guanylate kinase